MKILVMSSDNAKDTFMPFHYCMEKYGPDHPEIIYSTETITNPFYKTVNKNYSIQQGSKRVHDTIIDIDDNIILLMCEDIFIRDYVNNNLIRSLEQYFTNNVGSINFEASFSSNDQPFNKYLLKRPIGAKYNTSVMCSLGYKENMLKVFNINANPGEFESFNNHCNLIYYIAKDKSLINGGGESNKSHQGFGLHKGKGCLETKKFFDSEGLQVDYSRGFDI